MIGFANLFKETIIVLRQAYNFSLMSLVLPSTHKPFKKPRPECIKLANIAHIDYEALGSGKNAGKTSAELFQLALPSAPKIDWYALEEPWTLQKNPYSSKPEGNPADIAKEVIHFIK